MTYEEFLDWADEDTLAEWVDGEVVMTSPASARHQLVKTFLVRILSSFVELHGLGLLMDAPFQMKLPYSGREPDILFIASAHLSHLKRTYLDGPADLAVEIVSPESVERDREKKFGEYQAGGVREYWLIDPDIKAADFYQLDGSGVYQPVRPDAAGIYHSRELPDFWLRVEWLWQDPLPDPVRALLEVDRDAFAQYLRDRLGEVGL
jgi:Uma2 family endonuclease